MSSPHQAPRSIGLQPPASRGADDPPPPGQEAVVMAALAIGIVLMGIQLWLLTVALDLYLAGKGDQIWGLALVSAAIFLGGLLMTRLLRRRPGYPPKGGWMRRPGGQRM
jgi:hypothetical protein